MNKRTLGAGILALALPALLLSATAVGANAVDNATVTSEVTAIDSCAWVIAGAPGDMTLGSGVNGSGVDAVGAAVKYKGADLAVSATSPNLILGLAGTGNPGSATDALDSSECSFYNKLLAGGVTLQIDGLAFAASYTEDGSTYVADPVDNTLSFNLDGTNPLGVTTNSASCTTEFTVNADSDLSLADTPGVLISTTIIGTPVGPKTNVENLNVAGANVKCDIGLAFAVTIPEHSGVPAGAGFPYKFAGPIMTFTLTSVE